MSRLALLTAVLLLTAATAAEARSTSSRAASPADVVRKFVAELNRSYERARPCRLLSARLVALVDSPMMAGADPWLAESYTPRLRRRGCDLYLAAFQGYSRGVEGSDVVRVRVAVGRTRFVARRGPAVHLRVALAERFDARPRTRRSTTDVFLLRERQSWRIVGLGRLWRAGLHGDAPPRSLAELPRHLRWLRRTARRVRAAERALIGSYLRTRTAVAATSLALAEPSSTAEDPLRDAHRGWFGRPIADQERTSIDLRGASLSTAGGAVAFELRFRGPVPTEGSVTLTLTQSRTRSGLPVPDRVQADWSVSFHDGWASAWGGEGGLTALSGLRASAVGDTLWLVGGADLRGRGIDERRKRIDLARPLEWTVTAHEQIPGSEPLGEVWSDVLPNWEDRGERGGVIHRAAG